MGRLSKADCETIALADGKKLNPKAIAAHPVKAACVREIVAGRRWLPSHPVWQLISTEIERFHKRASRKGVSKQMATKKGPKKGGKKGGGKKMC